MRRRRRRGSCGGCGEGSVGDASDGEVTVGGRSDARFDVGGGRVAPALAALDAQISARGWSSAYRPAGALTSSQRLTMAAMDCNAALRVLEELPTLVACASCGWSAVIPRGEEWPLVHLAPEIDLAVRRRRCGGTIDEVRA